MRLTFSHDRNGSELTVEPEDDQEKAILALLDGGEAAVVKGGIAIRVTKFGSH